MHEMAREREGVIKFDLRFTPAAPPARSEVTELCAWREVLRRLGLTGQDPARYGGIGFGNLSRRLAPGAQRFVVTGSQCGLLPVIDERHFAVVTGCDPLVNRLVAEGPMAPSSESLTHAQIYALAETAQFVFHAHSPEIWRAAGRLGIPATAAHAAYGTPAMVAEVERLFRETRVRESRLFVMGGHEDGVVSFGSTAEQAGTALILALVRALALPLSD
jgi:ribulose-5-phosphate 4-epimerase/fuculose-1-phosphate aldolase